MTSIHSPTAYFAAFDAALEKLAAAAPGLALTRGAPLAEQVSMGVGGPARWLAVPADDAALVALLDFLRAGAAPWMMLGGGSNTVFDDGGYDGVVVKLGRGFRAVEAGPGEHQIICGAAAPLSAAMNFARRRGLAGLEWAAGVPGVVGGALAGNAGTPAGEICPIAESVEIIDAQGRRATLMRGDFTYAYRKSSLRGVVMLRAALQLAPDSAEAVGARVDAALAKRMTQPIGKRSAGCMFKNPPGDAAGRLIDQAGLKGMAVGRVHVAQEHANFMINEGGASAAEIRELMALVRARVGEKFGVELETEIHFLGEK